MGPSHLLLAQRPRPPPLDVLAFSRPSPRGPSPLGVSPTSSPHPPSRAALPPPGHLRAPAHPGPIAEAVCEITPADEPLSLVCGARGIHAPGPVGEARLPHVASSAHVHATTAKATDAGVLFTRRASSPPSMHAATTSPFSDISLASSPTHQAIPSVPSALVMPSASAAAVGPDQDVVRATAAALPLDVLHLGRVFAKTTSRGHMGMPAVDAASEGYAGSSRTSSPRVVAAAAVAAVAAGALASSASLRTTASQSFRNRVRPASYARSRRCAQCARCRRQAVAPTTPRVR